MNTQPKRTTIILASALITMCSFAAEPELQTCAVIESADKRLECFDTLASEERQEKADKFARPRASDNLKEKPPVTPEEAREAIGAGYLPDVKQPSSSTPSVEKHESGQKTAKEQAREGIAFTVVRLERDGHRRHIFYMDDGQTWKEIEPSQIFPPKNREFNVVINRGKLGDYRLRLEGKGKRTRVIRLK